MKEVRAIGRGVGLWVRPLITAVWMRAPVRTRDDARGDTASAAAADVQGDMVIVLNDGSKIEIRSIDKWQEIKQHIEAKIAEANAAKEANWAARAAAKKSAE